MQGKVGGIDFPMSKGLFISGKVVDSKGNPLNQIRVAGKTFSPNSYDVVRTDVNGNFKLYGFQPDAIVWLRLDGKGFAHMRRIVQFTDTALADPHITMYPEATISGMVVDQSGQPVEGAMIYVENADVYGASGNTASDAQGGLTFEKMVEGRFHVKHQTVADSSPFDDPILKTVTVASGQHLEGLQFVIAN